MLLHHIMMCFEIERARMRVCTCECLGARMYVRIYVCMALRECNYVNMLCLCMSVCARERMQEIVGVCVDMCVCGYCVCGYVCMCASASAYM